jgi:hypothetical protein
MEQRGSEMCTISFSLRDILASFLLPLGFCIFFLSTADCVALSRFLPSLLPFKRAMVAGINLCFDGLLVSQFFFKGLFVVVVVGLGARVDFVLYGVLISRKA